MIHDLLVRGSIVLCILLFVQSCQLLIKFIGNTCWLQRVPSLLQSETAFNKLFFYRRGYWHWCSHKIATFSMLRMAPFFHLKLPLDCRLCLDNSFLDSLIFCRHSSGLIFSARRGGPCRMAGCGLHSFGGWWLRREYRCLYSMLCFTKNGGLNERMRWVLESLNRVFTWVVCHQRLLDNVWLHNYLMALTFVWNCPVRRWMFLWICRDNWLTLFAWTATWRAVT